MKAGDVVYTHGCYGGGEKLTIVHHLCDGQVLVVDDEQVYTVVQDRYLISEEEYENIVSDKENEYADAIMDDIIDKGFKQERIIKILESKLHAKETL